MNAQIFFYHEPDERPRTIRADFPVIRDGSCRSWLNFGKDSKKVMSGEELRCAALAMDLQWFAAEDEGRIFEPTDFTFRKAREEGRVAKSQEFIAALGLLFPAIVLILLAPSMLKTCTEMLRFFYTRINELNPLTDGMTARLFLHYFVSLAWPLLTIAVLTGIISNLIQIGFLFTTKPLGPDFTKVLPKFGRYFGRIFSREGFFNLIKSLIKMAVIGVVAYFIIKSKFNELTNLQTAGLWAGITLIASLASQLLVITALLLLLLSFADIQFQRYQFRESLKMTREVAKEELKQEDGDPDMRRRLRSRYRELLSRNMLNAVPNADVVITNPTHYSVALEYNMDKMEAPTVIAKGEDELAFRIREVAKENEVPVVSHPPLTRTLYNETEIGDEIPIRYWNVVAIVLAKFFTFEQKQEKARRMAAKKASGMGA